MPFPEGPKPESRHSGEPIVLDVKTAHPVMEREAETVALNVPPALVQGVDGAERLFQVASPEEAVEPPWESDLAPSPHDWVRVCRSKIELTPPLGASTTAKVTVTELIVAPAGTLEATSNSTSARAAPPCRRPPA